MYVGLDGKFAPLDFPPGEMEAVLQMIRQGHVRKKMFNELVEEVFKKVKAISKHL